jgi:MFS family permease
MRTIGTIEGVGGPLGFVRGVTRYQWLVFFVAWAGWSLDATDFGLFSLVLRPALTELLGGNPSIADIGRVGGILSTVGLLGWSIGGFTFGIVADYIGRVRTLALSILIYSAFTGLQGLAHSPLELGIYRFFAGVGTGAEIIVGIPLVAEAFAETHRAKILGVMMTGGAMGSIIGGQVYALIGGYGWRYVFFAGVAPALLLLLIRRNMIEPEHFAAVRERRRTLAAGQTATAEEREFLRFVPLQLFNRELRFGTLVGLLLRSAHYWRSGQPSSGCRRSKA